MGLRLFDGVGSGEFCEHHLLEHDERLPGLIDIVVSENSRGIPQRGDGPYHFVPVCEHGVERRCQQHLPIEGSGLGSGHWCLGLGRAPGACQRSYKTSRR